jgi:hypothetical protein
MRHLNTHKSRIAGLLALALGAAALLALSGGAAAKDRRGDDHGHHGRHHHHHREFPMREAGTISSFDATTGKLTIALSGGESVTGLVTSATEIRCEGIDQRRDHGGGDNSGPGGGDDHDGRGTGPGDDNGGEFPAAAPAPGEPTCTTASLTPGAAVGEAELRLEGGAAFEEIELGFES